MNVPALACVLMVISTVRAFQYAELARYIDSHQEEYVEVQYNYFSLSNAFESPGSELSVKKVKIPK